MLDEKNVIGAASLGPLLKNRAERVKSWGIIYDGILVAQFHEFNKETHCCCSIIDNKNLYTYTYYYSKWAPKLFNFIKDGWNSIYEGQKAHTKYAALLLLFFRLGVHP